MSQSQKQCTKCGEWRDRSEFYRNRSRPDGLHGWCKPCMQKTKREHQRANRDEYNAYQRQYREGRGEQWQEYSRRAYAKHGEKIRAGVKKYYREVYSEKAKENARRWNKQNPEKVKAAHRKHYESHREEKAAYARAWCQANREKRQAYYNNYRARKENNGGSFTTKEWEELCAKYDYRCVCCGEQKPLTVDHIMPVSKGGSSDISNIQPLCKSCNSSKRDKTIDYRSPPTLSRCEHLLPAQSHACFTNSPLTMSMCAEGE